ncbi:MAG: FxLYD domain-containing protein, partial [Lysinibacillus sp.]
FDSPKRSAAWVKLDERAEVNQQNETKKKIDEMVKRIQFTKVKTEHGWTTYSATIENTSGVNLEWFDININLIDENDVVIDTESAYHSNVWKPNQKVLFDFNTQNTDFTKMEWEAEYSIIE